MIAGQRWSAATKSDRIALLRDLLSSAMIVRLRIPAERAAPRREPDDGEQEIGGLRRIGTTGGELRRAFRRDEAGVAMLPSVELAVEEGTAVPVIRQSWQVGVDARDEAACAIGGPPTSSLGLGVGVSAPSCFRQPFYRLRRKWLHYVAVLVNYIL